MEFKLTAAEVVRGIVLGVIFGTMLTISCAAYAQVPADILVLRVAGAYTVRALAPSDLDVGEICIYFVHQNVDGDILRCKPSGPNEVVEFKLTVPVARAAALEVRAKARDTSGNLSDFSPNKAIMDFSTPGQPVIVALLEWLKDTVSALSTSIM